MWFFSVCGRMTRGSRKGKDLWVVPLFPCGRCKDYQSRKVWKSDEKLVNSTKSVLPIVNPRSH